MAFSTWRQWRGEEALPQSMRGVSAFRAASWRQKASAWSRPGRERLPMQRRSGAFFPVLDGMSKPALRRASATRSGVWRRSPKTGSMAMRGRFFCHCPIWILRIFSFWRAVAMAQRCSEAVPIPPPAKFSRPRRVALRKSQARTMGFWSWDEASPGSPAPGRQMTGNRHQAFMSLTRVRMTLPSSMDSIPKPVSGKSWTAS